MFRQHDATNEVTLGGCQVTKSAYRARTETALCRWRSIVSRFSGRAGPTGAQRSGIRTELPDVESKRLQFLGRPRRR